MRTVPSRRADRPEERFGDPGNRPFHTGANASVLVATDGGSETFGEVGQLLEVMPRDDLLNLAPTVGLRDRNGYPFSGSRRI